MTQPDVCGRGACPCGRKPSPDLGPEWIQMDIGQNNGCGRKWTPRCRVDRNGVGRAKVALSICSPSQQLKPRNRLVHAHLGGLILDWNIGVCKLYWKVHSNFYFYVEVLLTLDAC